MKRGVSIFAFILLPLLTMAQSIVYEKDDSIAIENILHRHSPDKYKECGELAIAIAREFIDSKYVAGTLENGQEEPLYISCSKLDCTTFVELVIALTLSIRQEEPCFATVCSSLEKIRYREGCRKGYESRLHYTSWWTEDNTAKGIIEEVTTDTRNKHRRFDLNFMSTHPDNYAMLKSDTAMQGRIAELERPFCGISVPYIPKELLNEKKSSLKIKDGDIIALVTTIDGLDVSHIGFAFWRNEKLHLLHASSGKGKVIEDHVTLFDYLKNKSKQCGIRVIRIRK